MKVMKCIVLLCITSISCCYYLDAMDQAEEEQQPPQRTYEVTVTTPHYSFTAKKTFNVNSKDALEYVKLGMSDTANLVKTVHKHLQKTTVPLSRKSVEAIAKSTLLVAIHEESSKVLIESGLKKPGKAKL